MNSVQIVKYLLENNRHMEVATADKYGKPWVSPVFFVYDDEYNLYWVSNKDAIHSNNIKENSQVAIVVVGKLPDETTDGVYFDSEAIELQDEFEIKKAMELYIQRKQSDRFMIKSLNDITGDASWRIYKAVPKVISKRANATDEKSGQPITIREKVDLKE
jgi:uncharacterized protein YhbP (UPF0306 family)